MNKARKKALKALAIYIPPTAAVVYAIKLYAPDWAYLMLQALGVVCVIRIVWRDLVREMGEDE